MATLEGKRVVVVGGSSGIGFGVAKGSLISQAELVVIASSSEEKVKNAVSRLENEVSTRGLKGKVVGKVVDAGSGDSIKQFAEGLDEVDHLVWTPGSMRGGFKSFFQNSFKGTNLDEQKDIFDVRFWGAARAAQLLKFREGGSVVLTGGSAFSKPIPGVSVGISATGAIDAFTRGLAVDLAPIRVNSVFPGLVDTEFFNEAPKEIKDHIIADYSKKLLVKHVADGDEVAEAYLFLMKCSYITGKRIEVDGGLLLV